MLKFESTQIELEPKQSDRSRLLDSGAVNGSENELRMQKLCQFENRPITFNFEIYLFILNLK